MSKTFTTFTSRKDAGITCFRAECNDVLLAEICCNSATGNVVMGFNCVKVPTFKAEKVKSHLVNKGWRADQ